LIARSHSAALSQGCTCNMVPGPVVNLSKKQSQWGQISHTCNAVSVNTVLFNPVSVSQVSLLQNNTRSGGGSATV
jgi:hypothetical protein